MLYLLVRCIDSLDLTMSRTLVLFHWVGKPCSSLHSQQLPRGPEGMFFSLVSWASTQYYEFYSNKTSPQTSANANNSLSNSEFHQLTLPCLVNKNQCLRLLVKTLGMLKVDTNYIFLTWYSELYFPIPFQHDLLTIKSSLSSIF